MYDERRTNEIHFQSKPYISNISVAPTCFGAAGASSLGSPNDPDQIVRMLRHKCRIREGREWIPSVCCQSHSVPSTDSTQTVSTLFLHLFGTYDVAYVQFYQDPLGSLKMALLQRRNM
jgi:hypothetical protein